MDLKHAECVPEADMHKPSQETFYLPMHAVRKEESTTTKLRVVFDASAKSDLPFTPLLLMFSFDSVHIELLSPQTLAKCIGLSN